MPIGNSLIFLSGGRKPDEALVSNVMNQQLEELVQFIRQIVPQSKAIMNLSIDEKAGVVMFGWQSHKFIVKPSLEVLELRGINLMITGASILMQTALARTEKDRRVLGAVDESLGQVENFFSNHESEKGLTLLETVKQTVTKMGRLGQKQNKKAVRASSLKGA
jgi:hypothetical protein